MKKLYLISIITAFLVIFFSSCVKEGDCKTCNLVEYTGGNRSIKSSVEACGTEIDDYESRDPIIIGSTRTVYECE